MIKRYHEAPLSIFNKVQQLTDGDYALVHLFAQNGAYLEAFEKAVADGRDVILDNSIFELGTAFDGDQFAHWIEHLKPTWYIVPDSWKNGRETARMFFDFIGKYPKLPGKRIAVAQGHTFEEVAECYQELEPYADMIAFNLDFSSYSGLPKKGVPYCIRMSLGRVCILNDLVKCGVINWNKPHHLLGCGVPQEVMWYPDTWDFIRSIDTCNPVIHGMHGIKYQDQLPGMSEKLSVKMCDCIEQAVTPGLWRIVEHNILKMKQYDEMRTGRIWNE